LPISGRRMRTTRLAAAPPTRGRFAHPPPRKKAPDWAPSCVSVTVNLDAFEVNHRTLPRLTEKTVTSRSMTER
jgi:hypothetical protein